MDQTGRTQSPKALILLRPRKKTGPWVSEVRYENFGDVVVVLGTYHHPASKTICTFDAFVLIHTPDDKQIVEALFVLMNMEASYLLPEFVSATRRTRKRPKQ